MTHTYVRRGFTLIEILIVSGIVVVVGFFTTTTVYGWREHKTLSVTAEQMATLLREAVSSAVQQKEGADWGVQFHNDVASPPASYFAIFQEDALGSRVEISRHPLPASVKYDETFFSSGQDKYCTFAQITGQVEDASDCDEVKIFLTQNAEASSTIRIAETGAIAYTTYSCSFFRCNAVGVSIPPPGAKAPPKVGKPKLGK
jgi:prepilin-type N-terminal cleavage/methylation domain-containing protein